MKHFMLAVLMLSQTASAADNFFCTSEERDQTVQLTQLSKWEVQKDLDGVDYRAGFRISIHTAELASPSLVEDIIADKIDVQAFFNPKQELEGKSVAFNIFLDEMDQAVLYIGENSFQYTCEYR